MRSLLSFSKTDEQRNVGQKENLTIKILETSIFTFKKNVGRRGWWVRHCESNSATGMDRGVFIFLSCASLLSASFGTRVSMEFACQPTSITYFFDLYALWNIGAGASATCHPGALFEDCIPSASLKEWATEECGCL